MMKRFLTFLLCIWLGGAQAFAVDADEMFADPAKEERAREIGRNLRCLVCQNQSIFDSNAELAKDLRNVVRERIEAGDNDTEALAYIADRYGDYVLLQPPVGTHTAILWAAPAVFLSIGLWLLRGYHRSRRASAPLGEDERVAARRLLEEDRP